MKRTLWLQLVLSFLFLSALIISSFSWITLQLIDSHFEDYLTKRQDTQVATYVEGLEEAYIANQDWNETVVHQIGRDAMHNGIAIALYDQNNELVWETMSLMDHGMRAPSGEQHMQEMMEIFPDEFTQTAHTLEYNGTPVGEAVFGIMGVVAYTEQDATFIQETEKNLLLAALFALLSAVLFGTFIAKRVSAPMVDVSRFTKEIAQGNYANQLPVETGIKEMNELVSSVNELSDQLQRQQEIRNQLSSDIAHEIRTPLTTLKGNIEAMLDGIWEPTPERLQNCYEEVNRITRLIGQIDQINEIESHTYSLVQTDFDLTGLSRQVVTTFEALANSKQVKMDIAGKPVQIHADKDKVSQVITNLLANALKFTPPGGEIIITVNEQNEKAVLRIADTGEGIRQEDLDRIFERFYMSEPSRNSRLGGQGIGLAIVKSIMKAHKGTITVESTYGRGTTFTIMFPSEG